MELRIEKKGEKYYVYTPYSSEFVGRLKKGIGNAKWDRNEGAWSVPYDSIEEVREIMMDVFGMTDTEKDVVDVELTFNDKYLSENERSLVLFGREILVTRGRDSAVSAGKDVIIKKGNPSVKGSRKYRYIEVEEGTILRIKGAPKSKIDKLDERFSCRIVAPEEYESSGIPIASEGAKNSGDNVDNEDINKIIEKIVKKLNEQFKKRILEDEAEIEKLKERVTELEGMVKAG